MVHELKKIMEAYSNAKNKGLRSVMATLVNLDGSSYRRPGVRMLITEDGAMVGAVSGGCVEKEILKQSLSVFGSNEPKMITYDGRYRLGCDGVLYILIEPFQPNQEFFSAFEHCLEERTEVHIRSQFLKAVTTSKALGSSLIINSKSYVFREELKQIEQEIENTEVFLHKMDPCFRLVIIGAEHDAIQLCSFAAKLGWEVVIVTSVSNPQTISDFPGATELLQVEPEQLQLPWLNDKGAVVLMTHSYARDLKYLLALKDLQPSYIGLLGPVRRREKLLNEFLEHVPSIDEAFFDLVYGPAGLNIGAETAQEIAISICAEILSVVRNETPASLKNISGAIHCNLP